MFQLDRETWDKICKALNVEIGDLLDMAERRL
ncbi:MAG: helix-turn-helix domain-containing protein [Candidatus Tectomicrobia bacterium]|nr:helix-turn-helix domain-containing protein [Candidatus Tectomicrobia bacterium]